MDESEDPVASPVGNEHPWGGTVIQTGLSEPTYDTVVAERFGWPILDFSNAVAVHILDEFANRIFESIDRLKSESDESPLITNNTAFGDYFLVQSLSAAFFEAGSYLLFTEPLCYENSKIGSEILSLYDTGGEGSWFKVERETDPEKKRFEAIKRLQDRETFSDYIDHLEEYIGVDQGLLEQVSDLYGSRGNLVHGLMNLEEQGWDQARTTAESWGKCIQSLIDILHNKLAIHQGLYQGLK